MSKPDLSYFLTDLTTAGMQNTAVASALGSMFDPSKFNDRRYNFYVQFLDAIADPNNKAPYAVFGIENRSRKARKDTEEAVQQIRNKLEFLKNQMGITNFNADQFVANQNTTNEGKLKIKLDKRMKNNVFLRDFEFGKLSGGSGAQHGGSPEERFAKLVNEMNEAKKAKGNAATAEDTVRRLRVDYENDPVMSPMNDEITATDRVIMIALTYVLRAVALFLIEWGMNSYMVAGFENAFRLYMGIYVCLFLLIVMLANASFTNLFFRMIFYYLSTTPHGYGRIIVHLLVQLMLLPVPFLVRDGASVQEDDYTFERRRAVMNTLSQFTFFIWIFTSVIAFKY